MGAKRSKGKQRPDKRDKPKRNGEQYEAVNAEAEVTHGETTERRWNVEDRGAKDEQKSLAEH